MNCVGERQGVVNVLEPLLGDKFEVSLDVFCSCLWGLFNLGREYGEVVIEHRGADGLEERRERDGVIVVPSKAPPLSCIATRHGWNI